MNRESIWVLLIPGFPGDERDSNCLPAQQRFIRGINRYCPALQMVIITFQYPYREETYTWEGNTVIALGGKNRGGIARRLLWRRAMKKLDGLALQYRVTGILSFWAGECALVGKKWAARNQVPFRCWVMGQDCLPTNKYIRSATLAPAELIAISDASAAGMLEHHGLLPAHIIPIGIDAAWLPPAQHNKDITILCAGSLIPLKQYSLAVDVMKEVVRYFPGASMVLAGDGPAKKQLEQSIAASGLGNQVQLAGEQDHGDVLEMMSRSRLFLHPSSFEGFSMACLEALGCGAEVISFVQPMKSMPGKWHVVKDTAGMIRKVVALLASEPDCTGRFPYPLESTVRKVLELFGTSEENIPYSREAIAPAERCL